MRGIILGAAMLLGACGGQADDECPVLHGSYAETSTVMATDCQGLSVGQVGQATQYFPGICKQQGCSMRCAEGQGASEWTIEGTGKATVVVSDGTCTTTLDMTFAPAN